MRTATSSLTLYSGELAGVIAADLPASLQIRAEIETRRDRQLRYQNVARNGRRRPAPDPVQFGGRGGTDARRIAQPHIFADGRQIEIELVVVVGRVALQVERAAAGARRQLIDVNAIAREGKRAIHLAQAAGQSRIVGRSILDLNAALRQGIGNGASHRHVDCHQAGSREIRIETTQQVEVDLPVGREIEFPRTRQLNRTVPDDVGSFAHQMRRLDVNRLIRVGEPHRALVVQLGVFDIRLRGQSSFPSASTAADIAAAPASLPYRPPRSVR